MQHEETIFSPYIKNFDTIISNQSNAANEQQNSNQNTAANQEEINNQNKSTNQTQTQTYNQSYSINQNQTYNQNNSTNQSQAYNQSNSTNQYQAYNQNYSNNQNQSYNQNKETYQNQTYNQNYSNNQNQAYKQNNTTNQNQAYNQNNLNTNNELFKYENLNESANKSQQLENEQLDVNEQNKNLNNIIKEKDKTIYELKNKVNDLINKCKLFEYEIKRESRNIESNNNNNNNKDEVMNLLKQLESKNNEIRELKSRVGSGSNLTGGENLIAVIIVSVDEQINHYAIICKRSDKFVKVEEILYDRFPQFKKTDNYFLYKGKKINRFDTIEENGIPYSAIITINKYDK